MRDCRSTCRTRLVLGRLGRRLHPIRLCDYQGTLHDFEHTSVAFEGLTRAVGVRHCCAPRCRGTFATAQRMFSRCAGCGVMSLPEMHKGHPFKCSCAVLRMLTEKAKPPNILDVLPCLARQRFMDVCHIDYKPLALGGLCSANSFDLTIARHKSMDVKAL